MPLLTFDEGHRFICAQDLQEISICAISICIETSSKNNFRKLVLIKVTRDNFKIHVNFMKPTFLCSLRQDNAYDKK